ncbi:MAG: hypothetical protein J1F38_10400 [Muribaculaceae bacterium]|nr:hypothetical protein [Muribaculaceae bacterium]
MEPPEPVPTWGVGIPPEGLCNIWAKSGYWLLSICSYGELKKLETRLIMASNVLLEVGE